MRRGASEAAARAAAGLGLAATALKRPRRPRSGSIPIAASFFDSDRIAYSNISEEW